MKKKNIFNFSPSISKRFWEVVSYENNLSKYSEYLKTWEHMKKEDWMSKEEIKIYEDEYINFNQRQKELDKISEDMKHKQHKMFINNQPIMCL